MHPQTRDRERILEKKMSQPSLLERTWAPKPAIEKIAVGFRTPRFLLKLIDTQTPKRP